jgi:hypothetical protein
MRALFYVNSDIKMSVSRKEVSQFIIIVNNFKQQCHNLGLNEKISNPLIVNGTPTSFYSVDPSGEFETINSLQWKNTKINENGEIYIDRSDNNVTSLRNLVFEIDNLSLQEQQEIILKNKHAINRVVYSGKKSYHSRITLYDEPKNKEEYKFAHNYLNEKLFDNKADKQCSNPSRLTRRPNVIRTFKPMYPNIKQELIYENNIVFECDWVEQYKIIKEQQEFINMLNFSMSERPRAWFKTDNDYKMAINDAAKAFLEDTIQDGERHEKLGSAIASFKVHGWQWNEVENILNKHSKDIVRFGKKMFFNQLG